MMGRNIHFKGVIWKIIPKLSLLPLLIWSIVGTQNSKTSWSFGRSECNRVKGKNLSGGSRFFPLSVDPIMKVLLC